MTSIGPGRPSVFICYAGPDRENAVALRDALEQQGQASWCDAIDLVPGDRWDDVITQALGDAGFVLVLISRAGSAHDGWYAREEIARAIDDARDAGKRIIPVKLDRDLDKRMPYGLRRVVAVDAFDRNWPRIAEVIAAAIEGRAAVRGPAAGGWSRHRWKVLAGVAAALAAAAVGLAVCVERPLTWPGPAPVVVELPDGWLRVDRDEVSVADLGDCHLPEPPVDQRGWCAALGEVIAGDGISEAVIAGAGRRSVVGVSPAVAERICAMRGMRLPWDEEFMALLALGQPAWPADEAEFATLALRDVRGAQAIRRLATGAAEFVRVEGGYRVRGVPMVSTAAMRVAERAPSKALHEVASPPLGEAVAGPDTGFRCVGDVE